MDAPEKILSEINTLAAGKLRSAEDLACLLRNCSGGSEWQSLLTLSFHAKFIVRTSGVMARVGSQADGYEKLSVEFVENLGKARALLGELLENMPGEKASWTIRFLQLTPEALQNLMGLLYDISWIKNWEIDHRT
ncbi:MAG: hypothetical protein NTV54_12030 [Ignavibacteriales bacterium]|nr:hypothetical protein [Ignavibacteriales bacterium]